ncbi:MAG: hypothetical protein GOV15_03985 [Candidatus Diapherotrites archaeon]|nr:hypothetical protein [Candidatus Diapherotrites archaeon]
MVKEVTRELEKLPAEAITSRILKHYDLSEIKRNLAQEAAEKVTLEFGGSKVDSLTSIIDKEIMVYETKKTLVAKRGSPNAVPFKFPEALHWEVHSQVKKRVHEELRKL